MGLTSNGVDDDIGSVNKAENDESRNHRGYPTIDGFSVNFGHCPTEK